MKITITAIRYKMPGPTYEDKTQQCQAFVEGLKIGEQITLTRERDNEADPNAIAAYYRNNPIGYVAKEYCKYVHPKLKDGDYIHSVICDKSEHTVFVDVEGISVDEWLIPYLDKHTPESPLPDKIPLPFTVEERKMTLIAQQIIKLEVKQENLALAIGLLDDFLGVFECGLSVEDSDYLSKVLNRADKWKEALPMMDATETEVGKIGEFVVRLNDKQKFRKDYKSLFVRQLDRMREMAKSENGLFARFDNVNTESTTSLIPKYRGWIRRMFGSVGKDRMGSAIMYKNLSREELNVVLAVLVLLEKFENQNSPESRPVVERSNNKAGKPLSQLFAKAEIREQEAERVKKYFKAHKMGNYKWNCQKDNTITKVVRCFYEHWVNKHYWPENEHPKAPAIVRFFVYECDIQLDGVAEKPLADKLRGFLKGDYDVETYKKVGALFEE